MSVADILSVLGTTREQVTVSGMMIVAMIAEAAVIVALWRDRQRREDDLDAITTKFAEVAEKYDILATKVSQRFDELVGKMADRFFGEGK